jgi:glutamate synthase domain-containing protein 3
MMQRGRMIICGDAGMNLGDSMYDGTIYVGGEVEELGVDCVPGEMTELDLRYLTEKLAIYGIKTPRGVEKMQKYVSGKMLWNYASLEPNEKKLIL